MKEVEQELLDLLGVRLFTIYQSVDNGKEILASIRRVCDDDLCDSWPSAPRHWLILALSQKPLVIRNVKTVRN